MKRQKILFICYGNVARSQMAEAYYNKYTGSDDSQSAGVGIGVAERHKRPTSDVVKVMSEDDIDVSRKSVKLVTKEMIDGADKIIVMCDADDCPRSMIASAKTIHIPIPDPYELGVDYTRCVRDEIKNVVLNLIHSNDCFR